MIACAHHIPRFAARPCGVMWGDGCVAHNGEMHACEVIRDAKCHCTCGARVPVPVSIAHLAKKFGEIRRVLEQRRDASA